VPFTVMLEAGTYRAEWHDVERRAVTREGVVNAERRATLEFRSPFAASGGVVLYLKKIAHALVSRTMLVG